MIVNQKDGKISSGPNMVGLLVKTFVVLLRTGSNHTFFREHMVGGWEE